MTTLDRVVADVQSLCGNPPGFSNRLNDAYFALERASAAHSVFVNLHEEGRLVKRINWTVPANTRVTTLLPDVGGLRIVRLQPESELYRRWPNREITIVTLQKLQSYPWDAVAVDVPPEECAWWVENGDTMRLEFSARCTQAMPLEITYEPGAAQELDLERAPNYLQNFCFLLAAEAAFDLLPHFEYTAEQHARWLTVIQERRASGQALLAAYLQQNNGANGGFAERFGGYRMRRGWSGRHWR